MRPLALGLLLALTARSAASATTPDLLGATAQLRLAAGGSTSAPTPFRVVWVGHVALCMNGDGNHGHNPGYNPSLRAEEPAECREYSGVRVMASGGCAGCRFQGLRLVDVDASWSDFSQADLRGAVFKRTNLLRANFSKASLYGALMAQLYLGSLDFTQADLRWANLAGSNLTGANMKGARLNGTILSWAVLDGADMEYAHYDSDTVLPFDDEEAARRGMLKDD